MAWYWWAALAAYLVGSALCVGLPVLLFSTASHPILEAVLWTFFWPLWLAWEVIKLAAAAVVKLLPL